MQIDDLFKKNNIIAIAGNRDTAKTSLALSSLSYLRGKYPDLNIAVLGVNEELIPVMRDLNILVLTSKMDILDLRLKNYIVYIDEFAMLFNPDAKNKEQEKLNRFFDRLAHLNTKLMLSTCREGYFNKYMCGRITCFLVKQVEYEALVNGSWIKERIKAIISQSDYRLEADNKEFYIVCNDGTPTIKQVFKYEPLFDTKKDNKVLFPDVKAEIKTGKKDGKLNETQEVLK